MVGGWTDLLVFNCACDAADIGIAVVVALFPILWLSGVDRSKASFTGMTR